MSFNELYEKLNANEISHSSCVEMFSLCIFDKTKGLLHKFGLKERNYLKYASIYHDVGRIIDSVDHYMHSYEMISQTKSDKFSEDELEIIGLIAMFHSEKNPQTNNPFIKSLDKNHKNIVKKLSAILKIADFLDREHLELIKNIEIEFDKTNRIFYIIMNIIQDDYFPNLKTLSKKKALFEKVFEVQLVLKKKQKEY